MVLLDEEGIKKPDPVVFTATRPDGVLLRHAETGDGLSRIQQFCIGMVNQADEISGAGRRGGERLQEIERAALRRQQASRPAGETEQDRIAGHLLTFCHEPGDGDVRVDLSEDLVHPGAAADNTRLSREHLGSGCLFRINELRCNVAIAQVLCQCGSDGLADPFQKVH